MWAGGRQEAPLVTGLEPPRPWCLGARLDLDHRDAVSHERAALHVALGDGPIEEVTEAGQEPVTPDESVRPACGADGLQISLGHVGNRLSLESHHTTGCRDLACPHLPDLSVGLLGSPRAHVLATPRRRRSAFARAEVQHTVAVEDIPYRERSGQRDRRQRVGVDEGTASNVRTKPIAPGDRVVFRPRPRAHSVVASLVKLYRYSRPP